MVVQGFVRGVAWCHIHARSLGGLSSPKDYGGVLEKIRKKLGTTCFHMHFSGVEYTDRGEKKHLPLSSMQPDYAPLAAYLSASKIDATLICESPLLEEDAVFFKRILDDYGAKY